MCFSFTFTSSPEVDISTVGAGSFFSIFFLNDCVFWSAAYIMCALKVNACKKGKVNLNCIS